MKLFRRTPALFAVILVGACERAKTPPTTDTAVHAQGAPADSSSAPVAPAAWDPSGGPVLLIATETPTRAFVLVPDSANTSAGLANIPHPASVTLFGRNGTV